MAKQRLNLDSVVSEAATIVDEDGHDGLSLGRVAEQLGVKSSALYNHVDGIDALWHELSVHATVNLAECLRDAVVAKSGSAAIIAIAQAYRTFAAAQPGQYASTLLPAGTHSDALTAAHTQIVELFIAVMHSAGFDGDEAVHAARIVRSAIHGFVSLESIDALTRPNSTDASFTQLLDMLANRTPVGEAMDNDPPAA